MRAIATLYICACLLTTVTPNLALGNYVYELGPETLVGNSGTSFYTVTGTIVTDINSGALSPSDIVSWQWTATGDTSSFSLSSSVPQAYANILGKVIATPSEIYLAWNDPFETTDQLLLTTPFVPANESLGLNFNQVYQQGTGQGHIQMLELYNGAVNGFWQVNLGGGANFEPPPAVIATAVPEPSTIILAALCGLALLAMRRRSS
jgi:hypothetical protein